MVHHFVLALFAVLIVAPLVRADDLIGSWSYSNPAIGETIDMTFNADGSGTIDGDPIRFVRRGNQLIVTLDGERIAYTIQIDGNTLRASGGDLVGQMDFQRKGPAPGGEAGAKEAPPAADNPLSGKKPTEPAPAEPTGSNSIVGVWTDGNGQIIFNADGTCDYIGQRLTYTYDGATLKLHGPAGDVSMQVKIEGDTFIATVGGETQRLARGKPVAPAAAGADGAAGVYMYQEASVDPTNVMVITQYLTLYPDGTIGWFKTEMGASRTQVSDCLERFASYRTNPEAKGRTYGSWRADAAGNVQLQWTIWDNLQCNGRLDVASGKLTIEKMGILNEGATLTYDKQR